MVCKDQTQKNKVPTQRHILDCIRGDCYFFLNRDVRHKLKFAIYAFFLIFQYLRVSLNTKQEQNEIMENKELNYQQSTL